MNISKYMFLLHHLHICFVLTLQGTAPVTPLSAGALQSVTGSAASALIKDVSGHVTCGLPMLCNCIPLVVILTPPSLWLLLSGGAGPGEGACKCGDNCRCDKSCSACSAVHLCSAHHSVVSRAQMHVGVQLKTHLVHVTGVEHTPVWPFAKYMSVSSSVPLSYIVNCTCIPAECRCPPGCAGNCCSCTCQECKWHS